MKQMFNLRDTNIHLYITSYKRDGESRCTNTGKQLRGMALGVSLHTHFLRRVILKEDGAIEGTIENDLRSRSVLPLGTPKGTFCRWW